MQSTMTFASRRPLHIVDTSFLNDDDVLVNFADGTSAVYDVEELEKLRPAAKHIAPAASGDDRLPMYADAL